MSNKEELLEMYYSTPPFCRDSFLWYGFWFYLSHPFFLLQQLYCFFTGHIMKLRQEGYDSFYDAHVGEYACTKCGQDMLIVPEDRNKTEKEG